MEEKERNKAAEGLGSSLSSMLDDSDSLFARMRHAADDSHVSGSGTFGKFTVEYTYFYFFACGKMNRSEDDTLVQCEFCGAGEEQMILDEEKLNFKFWECLSAKNRELVDISYSRGKQIIVRSRWKSPVDNPVDSKDCEPGDIREITSAVHVKIDPDKQFSHYLTLFRMYTHLNLQGDLKTYLAELSNEIQKLPDMTSKDQANSQVLLILDKITFLLKWIESREIINLFPSSKELQIQIKNLHQDIKLLKDPESPQELRKASEIGQIVNKTDQILNRFTSIFLKIESELILPSKWKCSMCDGLFEVKDRHSIPEQCPKCGKIITKLTPIHD
jgi:rubrerythrin